MFRLATMVQMLGVLVFALGLPALFASIDRGDTVDNAVMVGGYVVMRVALVFQWLRAARQDPERRRACLTYATTVLVAQAGWIALLVARTSVGVMFLWAALLVLVEVTARCWPRPARAARPGTPTTSPSATACW
ncbi:hypothetical protein DQ238_11500 [Geodermatophilus sp. TF02-6]|nr:hypothetical protein DQ238_11500 [Geodermatophilus sp. TF02-6]